MVFNNAPVSPRTCFLRLSSPAEDPFTLYIAATPISLISLTFIVVSFTWHCLQCMKYVIVILIRHLERRIKHMKRFLNKYGTISLYVLWVIFKYIFWQIYIYMYIYI